ncbi:MAG: hypothetical protein ILM98_11255 [Kiritimatiellae bacterium]|nr:hypothetical protein [Kiritimatiellia bacterium]
MAQTPRRIAAIAILAFRETVRSRLVASTALAVAGAIAVVRRATGGTDGAAFHNFTFYSLAAVEAILCVAALVAAAAAISGETRAKTLQLARVKPVPMFQLLMGHWIGLCASLALILAAAMAAVRLVAPQPVPERCSARIRPVLPSVREVAEETVAMAIRGGETNQTELSAIRRDALAKLPFATVAFSPGEALNFRFTLPKPLDASRPMMLEVAFASDSYSSKPLSVVCAIRRADASRSNTGAEVANSDVEVAITNITARQLVIPVDTARLGGATELALTMRHGGAEGQMPVMLQPRQSLAILVPEHATSVNFIRAFLVLMPLLAMLAALGLALGSLFSLPVASFCAVGLALSVLSAGYSVSDPDILEFEDAMPPTALQRVTREMSVIVVRSIDFVARTATEPEPATMLADGIAVEGAEAVRSLAWNGLALPLTMLAVAAFVLERKELP